MTALEDELRTIIAADGPISVGHFMAQCLSHPKHGYYHTRDPLGVAGDFTTAPEISQMFGELLGLWAIAVWQMMGAPDPVWLIELGPGRGTLMADALRATRVSPEFRKALAGHLVETSPVLVARQQQTLADAGLPLAWHRDLSEVPSGPAIILANELFDALPVNQAMHMSDGWHERVVGLDREGRLSLALRPYAMRDFENAFPPAVRVAAPGAIFEWRSDALTLEIVRRLVRFGGAALIIDYGHAESSVGDTFQAVRDHAFDDPLAAPGYADLTAHVDFAAITRAARTAGARVHGPVAQGTFLRRLGIEARAAKLRASATPQQAADIDAALARLVNDDAMGTLFKAIALADPRLGPLPGFDS